MTSRRKRGPCQVHGIEQELRFKRLAKMCGLTKSVLLVLEYKETGRDVSVLKRGVHALGLIDRHDRIVLTVKKYHRKVGPGRGVRSYARMRLPV